MTRFALPNRRAASLALAVLASLSLASSASAATTCSTAISQPFKPWLDLAYYVLAPGGGFEPGTPAWTLNGASVVTGNESYAVSGPGTRSLKIPKGASATSPAFCGGLGWPISRLFAKGGGLLGTLNVTIIYTDGGGVLRSQGLGIVTASGTWKPSLPMLTLSGLPLLTGSDMKLKITAVGGDFQVDDVYIDPWMRH